MADALLRDYEKVYGDSAVQQGIEIIRNLIGREPTQQEIEVMKSEGAGWNSSQYGKGPTGFAREYAASMVAKQNQVSALAQMSGTQITPEEAAYIRDQIYKPGSNNRFIEDNFTSLVSNFLDQRKIDQLQNPAVSDDNSNNAARVISETLGREATPDEIAFFSKQLAQGDSPYELAQFLKTTPEYLDIQSKAEQEKYTQEAQAARDSLSQELLKQEEEAFKRSIPSILGSYMRAGRINSSGVDSAIAQERAKLSQQREAYMADLGYQDAVRGQGYNRENFVNSQGRGFQNYLRQNEPSYQARSFLTQFGTQLPFQQSADIRSRSRELEDYYRQQNDYERYLSQQRKANREAALYGLGGQIVGAGTTALLL